MTDQIVFMLQLIITGVAVGGVYSLMALGFVLIFKASSVVNFGPGELVLFGAYVAWATILPMNLPLYVALPLTFGVAILLGLVIERGVLRPLIGEPIISVIMVTFGVASVIRGFLNLTWGSDTRPFPVLFSPEPIHLGPVPVSPVHLWSFVGVLILLAVFSVVVAPRLRLRFSSVALAGTGMVCMAAVLVAIAFGAVPVVITAVVLSGAVMGVSNTVYTEMALEVSDAPKPVASAGYNFVRWFAGVIAPYAAPEIAERFNAETSFIIAALAALIAGAILIAMRSRLGRFGGAQQLEILASSVAQPAVVSAARASRLQPSQA